MQTSPEELGKYAVVYSKDLKEPGHINQEIEPQSISAVMTVRLHVQY